MSLASSSPAHPQNSEVKFNAANGAQLLTATHDQLTLEFRSTERRYPLRDCWRRQVCMGGPSGLGGALVAASGS